MHGNERNTCVPGTTAHAQRIRQLNDLFRTTSKGGVIVATLGFRALAANTRYDVLAQILTYDQFEDGNDPYGEHDMGTVRCGGERVLWKIDYYEPTLTAGSEDPADDDKTVRVMTVMLASEY